MWSRIQTEYAQIIPDNEHMFMAQCSAIEQLAAQLRDLQAPLSDTAVISKILHTLPPAYRHFLSAWDNVPAEDKTIRLLTSRLVKEEARTRAFADEVASPSNLALQVTSSPKPDADNAAWRPNSIRGRQGRGASTGWRSSRGRYPYNNGSRGGQQNGVTCAYCQKPGHAVGVCRMKLRDERQKKADEEQGQSGYDFSYVSSVRFVAKHVFDWFADSGATQHMTGQRSFLHNFVAVNSKGWSVRGIGNVKLPVRGTGQVEFISTVDGVERKGVLASVLYVPDLGTNLVSIATITDAGVKVLFSESQVTFSRQGRIEMFGQRMRKTLYLLSITAMPSRAHGEPEEVGLVAKSTASLTTWHNRLAHLNYASVIKMSPGNAVKGMDVLGPLDTPSTSCEGCIMGKMHRLSFKTGRTRAAEIGGLIHSDVCGPMQVATPGGSRFFVSFKDDFSGWCVITMLKNKSDVPEAFMKFSTLVEAETGMKVKVLRSDNGGEYLSAEFTEWLLKSGVRHETSAPYTPQQNGVAERLNRIIMEAVRCQIQAKGVPTYLWGEAVNCTVHVQNRSTTSSRNTTPY